MHWSSLFLSQLQLIVELRRPWSRAPRGEFDGKPDRGANGPVGGFAKLRRCLDLALHFLCAVTVLNRDEPDQRPRATPNGVLVGLLTALPIKGTAQRNRTSAGDAALLHLGERLRPKGAFAGLDALRFRQRLDIPIRFRPARRCPPLWVPSCAADYLAFNLPSFSVTVMSCLLRMIHSNSFARRSAPVFFLLKSAQSCTILSNVGYPPASRISDCRPDGHLGGGEE